MLCVITMVSQQQQQQRNDDDHLSSAAATDGNVPSVAEERRRIIPKSISWLLVILILAAVNISHSSKDLLPMISSIAGDDDYNSNVVMMEGQTSFTEHRAPPVVVQSTQHNMQMQNNVTHERILPSRNHSSRTKVNTTGDSSIEREPSSCNWCQGDSRIFNPSIRVQGGLTCSDI